VFAFSSRRVIEGVGVWECNVNMVSYLLYKYPNLAGMVVTTGMKKSLASSYRVDDVEVSLVRMC
jgi:hypothetical protein